MFKECLDSVKENSPLIHNITNYVTVNDVANAILAVAQVRLWQMKKKKPRKSLQFAMA